MPLVLAALALICTLSQPAPPAPELEIHASLSGFNLPPASRRCCAFDLHLRPTGELTVTVRLYPDPAIATSRLSPEEMARLRRVIDEALFFTLPDNVGDTPVDGDEHQMHVRLGTRTHTVTLYAWPDDWNQTSLDDEEVELTRRAYAVWTTVRALVTDPRAKVP